MKKLYSLFISIIFACTNINGQIWSPVGSGMNHIVSSFAVYNGELYAGGLFTLAGGIPVNNIAKWNDTSWSTVGGGLGMYGNNVNALAVYNNELYAVGQFRIAGGVPVIDIAKWDGTSWSTVGGGTDILVTSSAVFNNELYLGGWGGFTAGGVPVHNIIKWDGTSWSTVGEGIINGNVFALAVYNSEFYVGGEFESVGGVPGKCIIKWNGSSWSAVGGGMNKVFGDGRSVNSLTVFNNELYAGGNFDSAGGAPAKNIAKWNGSSWSAVGEGMNGSYCDDIGDYVFALSVYNNELYAGGGFGSAGGAPVNRIAKWNGSSWSPLGSGIDGCWVGPLEAYNGALYVGGFFTTAGGISANYIAKWSNCNTPVQPNSITGNTAVCSNSTQLYSVPPVSGAISYTWALPSGWTGSSTTNSIITTVGATSGIISVTANNGCSNSIAVTAITALSKPDTILGNIFPCSGTTQTYSVHPVNGATNYTWTLPSGWTGSSTTNSIAATVGNNSGIISVSAGNSCDYGVTKTVAITINHAPSRPGAITGNTTVNAGQSFNYLINAVSGATMYNWSLSGGGNIISGQHTTSASINWLTAGHYTLSVNAMNNCGVSSNETLNIMVSEVNNPFQIKIMPNPFPGEFYLTAKGVYNKTMRMEIINMIGQVIYRDEYLVATNDFSQLINLNKVASGVYEVKIFIDDKTYVKPIVRIN